MAISTGSTILASDILGLKPRVYVNTTGTYSLTTIAGERVIILARCKNTTFGTLSATLTYNGVTKDSFSPVGANAADRVPAFLMYSEIPGAGTANVVLNGGDEKLMIIILI